MIVKLHRCPALFEARTGQRLLPGIGEDGTFPARGIRRARRTDHGGSAAHGGGAVVIGPGADRGAAHLVPLTREWALSRVFAIRSAGFEVGGLDVFGAPDESERLRDVARDPVFREAVAWQSREALASAVAKLASDVRESPARRRRQEEVVAGYWQRYCAKNDTIGFFGPLARVLRRAAEQAPGAHVTLTEMFPGPDECWLRAPSGRYTRELRIVAVDTTRRPG
jgi:Lantibiotic dehydratase, N terminus